MQATLRDGSNGLLIQIPANLATQAGLRAGMAIEIILANGQLVIVPKVQPAATTYVDPILGLGQQPVTCNLPDAAENHDRYLYGSGNP